MVEELQVARGTTESIEIKTESHVYTFMATRRASGRCHMKATVSTKNVSPHPSLTENAGRHEFRERESDSFQSCLNGMRDFVNESRVMEKAEEWVNGLPA